MELNVIWVVIIAALIAFSHYTAVKKVYWAGYRAGANMVLKDWKESMGMGDDIK